MILISIIIALVIERLGARADYWQIGFYANTYLKHSQKQLSEKGLFNSPIGFLIWLMFTLMFVESSYGIGEHESLVSSGLQHFWGFEGKRY